MQVGNLLVQPMNLIHIVVESISTVLRNSADAESLMTSVEKLAPVLAEVFAVDQGKTIPSFIPASLANQNAAGHLCVCRGRFMLGILKQIPAAICEAGVPARISVLYDLGSDSASGNLLCGLDCSSKLFLPHHSDNESWQRFWSNLLRSATTSEAAIKFCENELTHLQARRAKDRSKYEADMAKAEENSTNPPIAAAQQTVDTVAEVPEVDVSGLRPVQTIFAEIGELWEELLPRSKDNESVPHKRGSLQSAVKLQVMELVLAEIHVHIVRRALDHMSTSGDQCLDAVLVDESMGKEGAFCARASAGLLLNFVEPLSLQPCLGAFKVAQFDMNQAYMRPPVAKGPLCGWQSMAWSVRSTKANPITGDPMEKAKIRWEYDKKNVKFIYAPSSFGHGKTVNISVMCPYLVVDGQCVGKENFELVRPWGSADREVFSTDSTAKSYKNKCQERMKRLKEKQDNAVNPSGMSALTKKWKAQATHSMT